MELVLLSIIKYRALLTAIANKSLTRAAHELGYTQPSISHMISSLEHEFGFPLLIRTKDGVYPTENARLLQYYMQEIISAENSMLATSYEIKGLEIGDLRVGSFFSTSIQWLPKIVASFLRDHPNINLSISEGNYSEVLSWVSQGVVDLAIISPPVPDNYDFIPLWEDEILAVVSTKNPLSQQKAIDINDLIQHPFITPHDGADESVQNVLSVEKLTPNIKFKIKGDLAMLAMIGENLGVSLIPALAIVHHNENVVMRPLLHKHVRTLGICIHSTKRASPAARAFIAEIQAFIAEFQVTL